MTNLTLADRWGNFAEFAKSHSRQIVALTLGYVFLLSLIGIQNVPYWDDLIRQETGITAWGAVDGRWGSEFVALLLNAGYPLVDLGLTTFIISGVLMAAASLIVVWAVIGPRATWFTFALALAWGLNPWMLNALAFRFDGPLIALSVLLAVSTIFFYRLRTPLLFIGYLIVTFVTANFFQPSLGLILIILMLCGLLDWLYGEADPREVLRNVGIGFGAVAGGLVLYALQSLVLGTDRFDISFDLANPLGAFLSNLISYIKIFIHDNTPIWTLFSVIALGLAVFALLRQSRRSPAASIAMLAIFLLLSVLASGGVLLFASADFVPTQPRFRFPLAMLIAMAAMIVSARNPFRIPELDNSVTPKPIWANAIKLIPQFVLVVFAYLWLSIVFLFANALHEQEISTRFQAETVFSDVLRLYRRGDEVRYDPRIFTDSIYLRRLGERFPIFANPYMIGSSQVNLHSIQHRYAQRAGLDTLTIVVDDAQDPCTFRSPNTVVLAGPRHETWRANANTICLMRPLVTDILVNTAEQQVITLDLIRFAFDNGYAPNPEYLELDDLQIALWSLSNPDDVQWVHPISIQDGIATFIVTAPLGGWQGDMLVAHYFLNNVQLSQQIWRLNGHNN